MNVVFRLVKSFSGPPEPGSRYDGPGPLVARRAVLAHIRIDARREIVIDCPEAVDGDAVGLHDRGREVHQALRVRHGRRRLQRAVDVERAQSGEIPRARLDELALTM